MLITTLTHRISNYLIEGSARRIKVSLAEGPIRASDQLLAKSSFN